MNTLYQKYCRLTYAAGGLWVAGGGQFGLLNQLVQLDWIIWALVMIPGLLVFTLTFSKVSPVGARAFGRCLLLAVVWSGVVSIFGEVAYFTRWSQPIEERVVVFSQLCICFGSLSFIPILRFYSLVRKEAAKTSPNAQP